MNIIGRALAKTPIVQTIRDDQRKVEKELEEAKTQAHLAQGITGVLDFFSERQEYWAKANHVAQKVSNIIGGSHAHGQ